MRSSTEEAISLVTKWKDEMTGIDFMFSGASGASFFLSGRLVEPPSPNDILGTAEGFDVKISAPLDEAVFDFFDTREARPESKDFVESKVVKALTATFPNGDKLTLFERRPERLS